MKPYAIMTCAEIREVLHRRAMGELELMEQIEEVDDASIYFHTHSYYLRGKYRHDPYPNDFATWVSEQVRDRVLSERLAVINPYALGNIGALRSELLSLIDSHLQGLGFSPRAMSGEPFEFIRAHIIPVPTGVEVRSRQELKSALSGAPPESLYFHFFEDAFHRGQRHGSLVTWIGEDLGEVDLAKAFAGINPYFLHLEHLREELLKAVDAAGRTR